MKKARRKLYSIAEMRKEGLNRKQRGALIAEMKQEINERQEAFYYQLWVDIPRKIKLKGWFRNLLKNRKFKMLREHKVAFIRSIPGCPSPMEIMELYEQNTRA